LVATCIYEKEYIPLHLKIKKSLNMLAIVTIAGQQFKVSEGQEIFVHQLEAAEGDSVTFDQVLMIIGADTKVGTPTISGASVKATVLDHLKGDKVIVFKKKRRKGYRKKNGHRQVFSKIKIESISI
jgi:large subunit ribosomal protein L21